MSSHPASSTNADTYGAVIVGAGLAGIYMLYRLRNLGLNAIAVDSANGVGGTWYHNRYPGARCDIESYLYSYSFSPELDNEWSWSERYAGQPEILRYIEHVTERFKLLPHIKLNTRINGARFDQHSNLWVLESSDNTVFTTRYCIMATGCLSAPVSPDIQNLHEFGGRIYHTSRWPQEETSFSGERVGVIGTGSSGVQVIPCIAKEASHLTVFQRTPNFCIPAHNRTLTDIEVQSIKSIYPLIRKAARNTPFGIGPAQPFPTSSALSVDDDSRELCYMSAWLKGDLFGLPLSYIDILYNQEANDTAANFVHKRIEHTVKDTAVAELLKPRTHGLGTKRMCLENGYYATYNKPNVELVDLNASPILHATKNGITTTRQHYPLDTLVLATGFDGMTGALLSMDISGIDGHTLKDSWADGPITYLGISVPDFPNMFIIAGAGSPSVLCNMTVAIEQHVDWIAQCIQHLDHNKTKVFDASHQAAATWTSECHHLVDNTLLESSPSWWRGANIHGKPQKFMPFFGGFVRYAEICQNVADDGYVGYNLQS
ncbi:flavin-containing monooxygenase [Mycobacteroides abscessus]